MGPEGLVSKIKLLNLNRKFYLEIFIKNDRNKHWGQRMAKEKVYTFYAVNATYLCKVKVIVSCLG